MSVTLKDAISKIRAWSRGETDGKGHGIKPDTLIRWLEELKAAREAISAAKLYIAARDKTKPAEEAEARVRFNKAIKVLDAAVPEDE